MTEYLSILGMVQFTAISTRHNLSFVCSRLAAGAHLRTDAHWHELFRTLSYWVASPGVGLLLKRGPESLSLVGYADADDAGDKENLSPTGGYLFTLGGAAVFWQAKKLQGATKLSSTKSGFEATVEAGKEGQKLRLLMKEFQLLKKGVPTTLYVDNMSAVKISQAGGLQRHMKHVDHHHMWLQDMVRLKKLKLQHIPTTVQPADLNKAARQGSLQLLLCSSWASSVCS
ncbi:unnamed protein product [Closterium sp. NIES-53]